MLFIGFDAATHLVLAGTTPQTGQLEDALARRRGVDRTHGSAGTALNQLRC
jgi:hypothetical protein